MPEDSYPGVYVEEVTFRSKAIPGVSTTIFLLAGVLLGAAAALALAKVRRRRFSPPP